MSKSTSGPLRMGIGLAKSRLATSLDKAMAIARKTEPESSEERKQMVTELLETVPRMESQITTMTEINNRWMQLIVDLSEDVADEEALYEKTAYGTGGYMHIVLEAKDVTSLLQHRLSRLEKVRVEVSSVTATPVSDATPSTHHSVPTAKPKQTAKLPKLELPKFTGNYLEWDYFWQLFRVNIHESELSNIEKFAYLRSLLFETAIPPIQGIAVTEDNYEVAVAALKARFERPSKQLVSSYYSQLKRLPVASTKVTDIQGTYDSCEQIFRLLETCGEEVNTNQSLVLDVFSKFPGQVIEQLFTHRGISSTSTLQEVRKALVEYIKSAESLCEIFEDLKPFGATKLSDRSENTKKLAVSPSPTYTSALAASDKPVNVVDDQPKAPCYFCEGSHFNAQCPNYPTIEQRTTRLQTLRRCVRCLSHTHEMKGCKTPGRTIKCFFCKTTGDHRSALCPKQFGSQATTLVANAAAAEIGSQQQTTDTKSSSSSSALLNSNVTSLLLTASTTITDPKTGQTVDARLVMDSGSHRTYIAEKCAELLRLSSNREDTVSVAVFGSKRTITVNSRVVEFRVNLRDGSFKLVTANTTPLITGGTVLPDRLPKAAQDWLGVMKQELADDYSLNSGQLDILVGCDYFWDFVTGAKISTAFGIHLLPSSLGLLLSGKLKNDDVDHISNQTSLLCLTETTHSHQVGLVASETRHVSKYPDIDEFWELDKVGIHDSPHEDDDARALDQFNKSIYLHEGRYHVQWPWKSDVSELPTNYQLALGRLRSLEKRLAADGGDLKTKYQAVIDDQLAKGVIEVVSDPRSPGHPVHYIPHHPVVRPTSTTTKVRIVYDASAKSRRDAKSINECLYRGPVLLPDLCSVLIRFRVNPIAIVSDIEKAFLQMALQPVDRDVTRFLWVKDPHAPFTPDNILVFRFCRVPFGFISSPFLLGGTIQYHLRSWQANIKSTSRAMIDADITSTVKTNTDTAEPAHDTDTAEKIAKDIYVDNVSSTVTNPQEAMKFYTESKGIFATAGMNLTEWCSNMPDFETLVPETDRCASRIIKVLGLKWNSEQDTVFLNQPSNWDPTCIATKRQVLTWVASIYDPLGLFQPVMLSAKIFLKDLWLKKRGWDEKLDGAEVGRWLAIQVTIRGLWSISLPRQTGIISEKSMLAVFCDASAEAYATVVYLISSRDGQTFTSNLIFSKSRLSPRSRSGEKVSIPRLELLGVVIGTRAGKFCQKALGCEGVPIFLFTDSSCVLTWLKTSKLLATFVSNRIREINSASITEFRHVSSSDNPADICTRGIPGSELAACSLWWHGPSWLGNGVAKWPASSFPSTTDDDEKAVAMEYKKGAVFHTILAGEGLGERGEVKTLLGLDPKDYSVLSRLLRVTVRCLRFIKLKVWKQLRPNTKQRHLALQELFENNFDTIHPTASDLRRATTVWVKKAQYDEYGKVFTAIQNRKSHPLVGQLSLTNHHDILQCCGRFDYALESPQVLRPVLLPKRHHITNLIVRQTHGTLFHAGVAHTLSQIRRSYWIPRGRAVVRKELNQCLHCRKRKGAPFSLPNMPPLPKERLSRSHPFQYVGLDYLGPVTVSMGEGVQKFWVCLFTCLAIRAIHLEWVADCSAQSFIDCLSRFIARWGCPDEIISDNAPQFRTVKDVIDRTWHGVFTAELTTSYLAIRGIRWKFITELAPWQGGFYERLVGVVKRSLNAVIGRRLLKWDEFVTLVTEAEAIVNSRPLTYLYEDFPSGKALRPCDFLLDQDSGTPDVDPAAALDGGEACRNVIRHWKYKQRRLNLLWNHWHDDYLLSLRERGTTDHRNPRVRVIETPQLNQVVIVKNSGMPRGTWKLARVNKIISSSDNIVRSVELQLPNRALIRRSVAHLYPIELPTASANDHNTPPPTEPIDRQLQTVTNDAPEERQDLGAQNVPTPDTNHIDSDDEDRFSGFSESEVYGNNRGEFNGLLIINNPVFQRTVSNGLVNEPMGGVMFELRQSSQ